VKKCQFDDPYYVALYYDGAMDEEMRDAFAAHLLVCKKCTGSLLNLERDLFLMEHIKEENAQAPSMWSRAVFRLGMEGLKVLKGFGRGSGAPFTIAPVALSPVRGKREKGSFYRITRGKVCLEIAAADRNHFSIRIRGISGKSLSLFRGRRLVEARAGADRETAFFDVLERGQYTFVVEGQIPIEFTVE